MKICTTCNTIQDKIDTQSSLTRLRVRLSREGPVENMHALKHEKQRCDPGGTVTKKWLGTPLFQQFQALVLEVANHAACTTRLELGFPCRRKEPVWVPGEGGWYRDQKCRRVSTEGFRVGAVYPSKVEATWNSAG